MDLEQTLEQIGGLMRQTKEDWVETKPQNTDIGIYLHCYRGENLIAAVQCPLNRDDALQAGSIVAAGFNTDVLAITFESYHSTLETSPITGKPWRPHEMQYVAQTQPEAYEKGWVSECLMTSIHERGGGFGLQSQPYLLRDYMVEWGEARSDTSAAGEHAIGGGYMLDYLQEVMSKPTIEELARQHAKSNPLAKVMTELITNPEARYFHMDMATYKRLSELKLVTGVVFSAEKGSDREKWLTERLGPPGVVQEI